MNVISVQDLKALVEGGLPVGTVVIDCRTPDEHALEHMPFTQLIPLDEIEQRADELKGFDQIFLHCRSGGRSADACQRLEALGFADLVNVEGGLLAWKDAGYELVS